METIRYFTIFITNTVTHPSKTELTLVSFHSAIPLGQSQYADLGTPEDQRQMRKMNPMPSIQKDPGPKLVSASYNPKGHSHMAHAHKDQNCTMQRP